MIEKYFEKIRNTLKDFGEIIQDDTLQPERIDKERGTVNGEVFFNNESVLSVNETVDTKKREKEKYSYHYMDKDNEMIFRYDNAAHHPEIETYPHHKHTPSGIEASKEPNLGDVLTEIDNSI